MGREIIDKFYADHAALDAYLMERKEISFALEASNNFKRSLVLAVASFFEHEISEIIRQMPAQHAAGNVLLTALVEAKAVSRQYHTYFDWDSLSANKFFGSFGDSCRTAFVAKTAKDPIFKASVRAFLELGQIRNRLVHRNYAQFYIDKTPKEIYGQFELALPFVDYIKATLLLSEPAPAAVATQ